MKVQKPDREVQQPYHRKVQKPYHSKVQKPNIKHVQKRSKKWISPQHWGSRDLPNQGSQNILSLFPNPALQNLDPCLVSITHSPFSSKFQNQHPLDSESLSKESCGKVKQKEVAGSYRSRGVKEGPDRMSAAGGAKWVVSGGWGVGRGREERKGAGVSLEI